MSRTVIERQIRTGASVVLALAMLVIGSAVANAQATVPAAKTLPEAKTGPESKTGATGKAAVGETALQERIGDWELVCSASEAAASGSKRACRLIQNHADASGKTALLVTILNSAASKEPVAIVSVPRTVYLAPGIELSVDNGQSFKLLYETCNDGGCHAGYKVAGAIAAALKKGKQAAHKMLDARQQPVVVPVSLSGLSKGLDRLAEVSR